MNNLDSSSPAVAQSEPASQDSAAATSVASAASTDDSAQTEAAGPEPAASAQAITNEAVPVKPDHPFTFRPSLLNPLRQVCDVEGCFFTQEAHPHPAMPPVQLASDDNGEPHPHELERMIDEGGPCPEKRLESGFYRRPQLRGLAADFGGRPTLQIGDTSSFEKRLAEVEKGLAELRKITDHHGLRGPQS